MQLNNLADKIFRLALKSRLGVNTILGKCAPGGGLFGNLPRILLTEVDHL